MNVFDEYQQQAKQTAVYPPGRALEYLTLGLASEAGEVAGKVKKYFRDGGYLPVEDLAAELGDALWYVAMLADHIGYTLTDVAALNLAKLKSRQQRGKLKGNGDNR